MNLTVFVVNGDEHEVQISDPDGRKVVPKTKWNREYKVSFVAKEIGPYQLTCSIHAPTMSATFLALPREGRKGFWELPDWDLRWGRKTSGPWFSPRPF